uniref:Ldh_1_C domain-containing protein n=1 Tax=Angiostrongylus cantonensis TaxID=6313 RepID=A0A0K0DE08_ANGCA
MPDRPSYIKILVAFNPPIIPSRITPQRRVESLESEKILSQCHVWSNTCSSMYESRRYVALVTDINGKSVLASRFLSPVHPPSSVPKPTTEPMHSVKIAAQLVRSGLPEGLNAAYVLVNMHDGIYLVNPCNGCIYSSADTMCPIISVGTIITPTNIYGNVQLYSHPSQMNFDLNVSEDALVELRSAIEREIKLCFDEARQYGIPQWNLMASR